MGFPASELTFKVYSAMSWLSISVSSWRHNKILVENLEFSPNPSEYW